MLLLRYDKFLETYHPDNFKRDKVIKSFAEQEDLATRDVKARLNEAHINQIKICISMGTTDYLLPKIIDKYAIYQNDYNILIKKARLQLQEEEEVNQLYANAVQRY